jgi:hypothetical protein
MLAGVFMLCELVGATTCEAASPRAALRCCPRFRGAGTSARGSLLLDAPIVDVTRSFVVRPNDQDALRENGDAKPRPRRKWRQNKDFSRRNLFLTGGVGALFLPSRANIAERMRCVAR